MRIRNFPPRHADALAENYRLSTDEYAAQNLVQSQTVRKQFSATGSYFGVRPIRLPNRRLLWPDNTIVNLVAASGAGVSEVAGGAQ